MQPLTITFLRIPPRLDRLAHPQERQLPLSIASSAACLIRAGHRVKVIDLVVDDAWTGHAGQDGSDERLSEIKCDLLVMQVDSLNLNEVLVASRAIGQRKIHPRRVAMGQYAEVFPERLLLVEEGKGREAFELCIIGEPEETLVELAAYCAQASSNKECESHDLGSIRGIAWPDGTGGVVRNVERPLIEDLDSLPQPAYQLFDLDAYAKQSAFVPVLGRVRWGWIMASRGCPFGCEFCSRTLRKSCGSKYRKHSPAYVADLAEKLVHEHGCKAIAFEDDVFSLSRRHTLGLADEFIRRQIPVYWTAQTHLATLDEELIARMHQAGCRGLLMGIESGNDELRDRLKNRSLDRDTALRNVRLLHKYGINTTLYFMIGAPGERLEQMEQTLELALQLKPMMIQLAFFTPYPGSEAYERCSEMQPENTNISHYNNFAINLSEASREDVLSFYRRFYRRFYLNPGYIWRFITRRLPYTLSQNGGREGRLMLRSLRYFAGRRQGKVG